MALLLLLACGAVSGQVPPGYLCPSIFLEAPEWPLTDGDTAKFTVRMDPKDPDWKIKYQWTLSSGKIVSGQGTDSIEVERKIHFVNATVHLDGFPHYGHCPQVAAQQATWSVPPVAEKIKTFQGSKLERTFELGPIVDLSGFKNQNLVVFLGFKQDATDEIIQARESEVLKEIGGRLERDRYDLITVSDSSDVTEFWKVPVGAKNPTCETCIRTPSIKKQDCPTISVSGPPGIIDPGDPFVFTSNVNGELPKGISYLWTVSEGDIESGQGTSSIKVAAQWKTQINITASLKVVGLPAGCPFEFHETASVVCRCTPTFIDEFQITTAKIDRTKLDLLVGQLRNDDTSVGYIIEYFPSKTGRRVIDKKIEMITKYLVQIKKLRQEQFKIVIATSDANRTKLFTVPPGAEFPNP